MISHGGGVKVKYVNQIFRATLISVCLVLWLTVQRANGWLIMNKDGALSFIAPLEIDAAYGSSKLTFKAEHEAKWDIYLDHEGSLQVSELVHGISHAVIATNNTFKINDKVEMLQSSSVLGITHFDIFLSIQGVSRLELALFVSGFAHQSSLLPIRSHAHSGLASFACRMSQVSTLPPMLDHLSLGSPLFLKGSS